jgi:non-ribosomal peptide synthetase component E (peptide arylation enzyme)
VNRKENCGEIRDTGHKFGTGEGFTVEKIWMKHWPSGVPTTLDYVQGKRPIFAYLSHYARVHPEKIAIHYYGYEITYAQLDDMTDRFASFLARTGVKKGDRVALYLQNCPS